MRWIVIGVVGLSLLTSAMAITWRLKTDRDKDRSRASAAAMTPPPARETAPPPASEAAPSPTSTTTLSSAAAAPALPVAPIRPAVRHFEVAVTIVPGDAVIELDGVKVGRGSYRALLPLNGARHIMTVRRDGYEEVGLDFTDQPPPVLIQLDPIRTGTESRRRSSDRSAGSTSGIN